MEKTGLFLIGQARLSDLPISSISIVFIALFGMVSDIDQTHPFPAKIQELIGFCFGFYFCINSRLYRLTVYRLDLVVKWSFAHALPPRC